MQQVQGRLFDGRTTAIQAASVSIIGDSFELTTTASAQRFARDEVVIRERIGNNPRVFEFPGGLRFETDANDTVDRYFARQSGLGLVHFLEDNWSVVAVCTAFLIVFALFCYYIVLPQVARKVAYKLKQSDLEWISEKSWDAMNSSFEKSELAEADAERVRQQFEAVRKSFPGYHMKLELRRGMGGVKLNAFALPDGRVIFTDKMAELLTDPDEIRAVLLHEMGHVVYRHGTQNAIQALAVSGFFMLIAGGADWSSIAGVLVSQSYSRDHEREADYFAADELKKIGKKPSALAEALQRMQRQSDTAAEKMPGFLLSHPITDERIKYLRSYD